MYQRLEELRGYRLDAKDGHIGRVRDFLFDEEQWGGRWLVADTGKWLLGKKVLISPISLNEPDHDDKLLPVKMTQQEIEDSPHLDEDAPVSREYEKTFFDQYHWPYYWMGGGMWGNTAHPMYLHPDFNRDNGEMELEDGPESGEHVLRSAHELTKYQVEAADDGIGHIDDVILDTEAWVVRYVVVDTRNWLPGKHVLLSPAWIREISWTDHRVRVDLEREKIKSAPEYDKDQPITREYEQKVYEHYGQEGYW